MVGRKTLEKKRIKQRINFYAGNHTKMDDKPQAFKKHLPGNRRSW